MNVRGVAVTMKHGARALRGERRRDRGDGVDERLHAAPAQGAYTASKHAVLGLVRTAALDLGRTGSASTPSGPGPVATEAFRERLARREAEGGLTADEALRQAAAGTALGRMVTEDDVARAALFSRATSRPASPARSIPVDGGFR